MTISATTQGLRMGVATSSSRPSVPFDGQVISETDTDSLQVYKGSAWAPVSGLTLISATTLSGTTSINDCFSAKYTNYNIRLNATMPAGTVLRMRYRVSSADNTTSNYDSGSTTSYTGSASASFQSQGVAGSSFNLALPTGCKGWNGTLDVCNPFATDYASITSTNVYTQNTYPEFYMVSGFNFRLTTSFTGVTFFTDSGNLTGTVKVYGLADA